MRSRIEPYPDQVGFMLSGDGSGFSIMRRLYTIFFFKRVRRSSRSMAVAESLDKQTFLERECRKSTNDVNIP